MIYISDDIEAYVTTAYPYYRVKNELTGEYLYYGKVNGSKNIKLNDIVRSSFTNEIISQDTDEYAYYNFKKDNILLLPKITVEKSDNPSFTTIGSRESFTNIINVSRFFGHNFSSNFSSDSSVKAYDDFDYLYSDTEKVNVSEFGIHDTFNINYIIPAQFVYLTGQTTYIDYPTLKIDLLGDNNLSVSSIVLNLYESNVHLDFTTANFNFNIKGIKNMFEEEGFTQWDTWTNGVRFTLQGTYHNGTSEISDYILSTFSRPLVYSGGTKKICKGDYSIITIGSEGQTLQLPSFGYNKYHRSYEKKNYQSDILTTTVYENKITESIEINTGWINESQVQLYENIYASNKLALKDINRNIIYGVSNATNTWTEYKYLSDKKLYNIKLTLNIDKKLLQQY